MAAAGQISLDDLRAAGGVHDDFLDQMLGGLQPSAWPPELASAAGAKAPGGGAEAEEEAQRPALQAQVARPEHHQGSYRSPWTHASFLMDHYCWRRGIDDPGH